MNKPFKIFFYTLALIFTNVAFGQYSGTYTVGGSNPDFPRLDTAFKWLALKGVSGSVRLNVRSGTYSQRFRIDRINGSSNTNIIKIAPDPANTAPVIYQNSIPYTNAYIVEFYQGFVHIDSIEFKALRPGSMAGQIVAFSNNCENISFNKYKFYGIDTSALGGPGPYYRIIYKKDYTKLNNFKILNCTFYGGSDAINIEGSSTNIATNIEIKNNSFYNHTFKSCFQENGIYLTYVNSPVVEGNQIYYDLTGNGLVFINCSSALIKGNKIYTTLRRCFDIVNGSGSANSPNLIANNFFSTYYNNGVSFPTAPVNCYDGSYYYLYNNTFYTYGSDNFLSVNVSNINFNFNSGGKKYCIFKNNNVVSNMGGRALYLEAKTLEGISEMDYNNYYTDGRYLAYNGTDLIDFDQFKKNTSLDSHSVNSKVVFTSLSDLHTINAALDSAGIPAKDVTTDIDGNTRDSKKPDIGADEFDYFKNDIGILKFSTSDFSNCGNDSINLGVIIKNIGTASQTNFKVNFEVKNDSNFSWSGAVNYTKTLKLEMIDTLRFLKFKTLNGGRYKFKAITNLTGDADKSSDTLSMMKILTKVAVKPKSGFDTICNNITYSLGAGNPTANSYRWYNVAIGGKPIGDKPTYIVNNLKKDSTFYLTTVTKGSLPGEIKTLPNQSVKCSIWGGAFFDITPKVDMTIDSFANYFYHYAKGSYLAIYFKRGSYSGFESLPKKWTRLDSVKISSNTLRQPLSFSLKNGVALKKDTTYSFYIFGAEQQYSSKPTITQYSNSDITINLGGGTCKYFSTGTNFYTGYFYYSKIIDCESERVPYKVKVKIAPVVNLGRDTSYCSTLEDSLTLNAGSGYAQYIWNTAQTTQTIKINKAGKYSVKVVNNSCPTFDTIVVNKFIKSKINLGNDTAYCSRNGINYNLNPGAGFKSYQWNTGSTSQILNVKSNGMYSVKVVDKNNCEGFDSLKVIKNISPVVNLGRDSTYCINTKDSFKLKAGAGYKAYQWSTFEVSPQISIVKTGKYSVIISDSNNCKAGDTISIGINQKPYLNLGKDTIYCGNTGINLVLDAGTGNTTYKWSTSEITSKITIKSGGNYSVEVMGSNKCKNNDTIKITSQTPAVNLGLDRILNPDNPINEILNAGPGFKTYEWNTLSKIQTIKVTKEGLYFVKVTDEKGCEGKDSIEVRYWKKGELSILGESKIKIYPNPTKNLLNVVSENSVIQKFEVFEMSGKSVFTSFEKTKDLIINTSYWANGFYMIALTVDGKTYKMKVSVQH